MEHTFKILVTDDEPGMTLGMKKVLKNHKTELEEYQSLIGYEVLCASTGEEALKILDSENIEILILDHKLPDMTGLEILKRLQSRKEKKIWTLMVTAYASFDVAISATRSGAFDFIPKPFTPDEIRTRIDKLCATIFLHHKTKRLQEEKKKIRFEFLSVLAHELKSPINAVDGYMKLISQGFCGKTLPEILPSIERCEKRISQMRKLILDLLDLTRLEAGNRKRELQELNPAKIMEDQLLAFEPQAKEKNILVKGECPKNLIIFADELEIGLILSNLISNAIKYNNPEGSVFLKISLMDEKLVISCKDSGIGMSEEEVKKLFSEFSRIKNNKTRDIEGSGLGLSILKKLCILYDGEIKVFSREDQGSEFVLTLNCKGTI